MVVVVPAFAERDERQPEVVARVVARRVAARAVAVRERVDAERRVVQHAPWRRRSPTPPAARRWCRAPARTLRASAPARIQQRAQQRAAPAHPSGRGSAVPDSARDRGDERAARREVRARHEPADVAAPEPVAQRRMAVFLLVGVRMMMAMVRRPPERPALRRRCAEQREHELRGAARCGMRGARSSGGRTPVIANMRSAYSAAATSKRRGADADPEHARQPTWIAMNGSIRMTSTP